MNRTDRRADQSGDGFDDEILEGSVESRTADIFNSGRIIVIRPSSHRAEGGHKVTFGYPENALFRITAELTADTTTGHPLLTYRLTAKTGGWYSVGFTGFAGTEPERTDEIWQPLIWQEKRFPDKSYLTLAFRCPVPSAFITSRNTTYGILAHLPNFRSIRCRQPPTAVSASPCATAKAWHHRCCSPRFRAASAPKLPQAGNSLFPHCSADSGATPRMRSGMSQRTCSALQPTETMRSVRSTRRSKT